MIGTSPETIWVKAEIIADISLSLFKPGNNISLDNVGDSFIFSLSPNDMTDLCTLYEKAGQINENEAENIVNLPRGSAFLITGPANRTNIRIVATPHVKNTFEN